jgi:hypothetical protein
MLSAMRGEPWLAVEHVFCASCSKPIIWILNRCDTEPPDVERGEMIYPKIYSTREAAPAEVPQDLARDYNQACNVLEISPQAAAALARRCLQQILRVKVRVDPKKLFNEIDDPKVKQALPDYILEKLHFVRKIGNAAAHPMQSAEPGQLFEVEPDEAEHCLDAIADMFEHLYVAPVKSAARQKATEAKFGARNKPSGP